MSALLEIPEPNTVPRVLPVTAIGAKLSAGGTTMDNRHVNIAGQEDRELEELLCLAYLFTHSVYAETPDECEVLLADNGDIFPIHCWN